MDIEQYRKHQKFEFKPIKAQCKVLRFKNKKEYEYEWINCEIIGTSGLTHDNQILFICKTSTETIIRTEKMIKFI